MPSRNGPSAERTLCCLLPFFWLGRPAGFLRPRSIKTMGMLGPIKRAQASKVSVTHPIKLRSGRSRPLSFTSRLQQRRAKLAVVLLGGRGDVMEERRTVARRRTLKSAQIILNDKTPKLECTARNVSTKGARFRVSSTFGIPAKFHAVVEGVRRSCRTVWRTETELGVRFEDAD